MVLQYLQTYSWVLGWVLKQVCLGTLRLQWRDVTKELDALKLYYLYNSTYFLTALLFLKMKMSLESWSVSVNVWIINVSHLEGSLMSEMLYHVDRLKSCWWLTFCAFYLQKLIGEVFNIVSQQSTARPGCIIELDAIADQVKTHLWIAHINILYPRVP